MVQVNPNPLQRLPPGNIIVQRLPGSTGQLGQPPQLLQQPVGLRLVNPQSLQLSSNRASSQGVGVAPTTNQPSSSASSSSSSTSKSPSEIVIEVLKVGDQPGQAGTATIRTLPQSQRVQSANVAAGLSAQQVLIQHQLSPSSQQQQQAPVGNLTQRRFVLSPGSILTSKSGVATGNVGVRPNVVIGRPTSASNFGKAITILRPALANPTSTSNSTPAVQLLGQQEQILRLNPQQQFVIQQQQTLPQQQQQTLPQQQQQHQQQQRQLIRLQSVTPEGKTVIHHPQLKIQQLLQLRQQQQQLQQQHQIQQQQQIQARQQQLAQTILIPADASNAQRIAPINATVIPSSNAGK